MGPADRRAEPVPARKPAKTSGLKVKLSPSPSEKRRVNATIGSFARTGMVSVCRSLRPSGVVSTTSNRGSPTVEAETGTVKLALAFSVSRKPPGDWPTVIPAPAFSTASCIRPAGPSACTTSSKMRLWSPGARKRGTVAVTTTGSRTNMSCSACPTASRVQATAINLTVPLKAGRSTFTNASPLASVCTEPEKTAISSCVGGGLCMLEPELASPPDRTVPMAPFIPSISRP